MLMENEMVDIQQATIDRIDLPEITGKKIRVDVLRLDKIHPVLSGNKWFKLKYYLLDALQEKKPVITFGGAFSNHILATAYTAHKLNLPSTGIIRGEESASLSHTLLMAKELGMKLKFIPRNEYVKISNENFTGDLELMYPGSLIIPEGGAGYPGIRGAGEIMHLVNADQYSHIACAVGSATTFSGLAQVSTPGQTTLGICVLKGMDDWSAGITSLLEKTGKLRHCQINNDYHFGGYAKKNKELFHFMNCLYDKTRIPTDFVYTAKLFYAVFDLIRKNHFALGSKVLIVHSGGLQGNNSLPDKTLNFN